MDKKYDYLYIAYNNLIMGRKDNETYSKDTQGVRLGMGGDLESAKSLANDLIYKHNLNTEDIIISLSHKELTRKRKVSNGN